jgi:hypothetical protein
LRLVSGLTLVSGYAHKVRRTIYAQLKDLIKAGVIDPRIVAYRVGFLNRLLFKTLVEELKLDKHDVVRISIDYEVVNGDIEWELDTLKVEVWKEAPELEDKAVEAFKRIAIEEMRKLIPSVEARKVGESALGDEIYEITRDGERVGVVRVTPLGDEVVVTGVAIGEDAVPYRFRTRAPRSESIDQVIAIAIERGEKISQEEFEREMKALLSMAK